MADERGFYVIRDLKYSTEPTDEQVEQVRQRLGGVPAEEGQCDLCKNLLDLYLPTTATDRGCPVVVFVHGGGWRRGNKMAWKHFLSIYDTNFLVCCLLWLCDMYGSIGSWCARNGIACVVISYPLARLSFPLSVVEMFTSFVFSLAFWVLLTTALTAVSLLLSGLYVAVYGLVKPLMSDELLTLVEDAQLRLDESDVGVWRDAILSAIASMSPLDVCSAFIAMTQAVTWLCIVYRRRDYRISPSTLAVQVVALGVLAQRLHAHDTDLHTAVVASCVFLLVIVQATIYTRRYAVVQPARYPENVNAVAASIRWTKAFGRKTGLYRPDRLFLMGHSAGGHLVALVALQGAGHADRLAVTDDIKGVLCLSAVYELTPLSDTLLSRCLYLVPTFGRDPRVWRKASPVLQLARRSHQYIPPFLVVTASWDFSLSQQADNFLHEYRRHNDRDDDETCRHIIPRTNHLDIIWRFRSHDLLTTCCVQFIRSVVRRLDGLGESAREEDHVIDGVV